jgi:hypothetical protein
LSAVGIAATLDPLEAATYAVWYTLIYDGFQESPVFFERNTNFVNTIRAIAANEKLRVTFDIEGLFERAHYEQNTPGSRRWTAIRIYLAQVEDFGGATDFEASTPFFFVKEQNIASTDWSGAGTAGDPYTLQLDIFGRDWEAGKKNEAELIHGYFAEVRVSADFAETINGKEVVASLVVGTESDNEDKTNYLIYSAINSAKRNTPDALPETDIKDLAEHGIYEIFNIKLLRDKAAIFGENRLVVLKGTEESDAFDEVGVNWYWSVASKGEKIAWGNTNSIYDLFDGGRPVEIGFPIRNEWQSLSTDNRKKSIAVFYQEDGLFILHSPSGTTYIYDEVQKSWRTYVADKSWEWLDTGVDGELLATDKTNIYQLFPPSGATESITGTYEKVIDFEKPVAVNSFQMMYKITGVITVKIFDLEKGDDYHIAELSFFSKSEFEAETRRISFRVKKIMVQLTFSPTAASNHDYEMDWFSMYGHELTENI